MHEFEVDLVHEEWDDSDPDDTNEDVVVAFADGRR